MVTGANITLYVDGVSYGTLAAPLPALSTIAYLGGDATTGTLAAVSATPPAAAPATPAKPAAATAAPTAPSAAAPTGFIGSIDELDISNIARPLGYIQFAAYGQGNNPLAGKLLAYGTEEKPASWFSGPFAVILGSVTPDGWVIIGILTMMALVSWTVMADKVSYVGRVGKANDKFLERYRNHNGSLTSLPQNHGDLACLKPRRFTASTRSARRKSANVLHTNTVSACSPRNPSPGHPRRAGRRHRPPRPKN